MVEVEPIPFEVSSGNVFADLGLSDPEGRLAKSSMVVAISRAIKAKGLSQVAAAEMLGMDESTFTSLLRGRTKEFSLDRLTEMLRVLGRSVEIRVMEDIAPADERGHVTVELAA